MIAEHVPAGTFGRGGGGGGVGGGGGPAMHQKHTKDSSNMEERKWRDDSLTSACVR